MGEYTSREYSYDWLVPGLLERQDRLLLTGAEGGGKTVLTRQFGVTLAAGLHPFTGHVIPGNEAGFRVLVIDAENSEQQTARGYKWIIAKAQGLRERQGLTGEEWQKNLLVSCHPGGIDLQAPHDINQVDKALTDIAPDMLIAGPLYKLHMANPNEESPLRQIVGTIDSMRERHNVALITECHAGNGTGPNGQRDMRPIGSSLLRRWPEFGLGMSRAKTDPGIGRAKIVDLLPWRGGRDERDWPDQLCHGDYLPWKATDPEYFDKVSKWDYAE
ncbi:ATP-binding protein [Nocardia goodfellowii]